MNDLPPAVSRAAALALLAAVIAALGLFVVLPLWEGANSAREDLEIKERLVARMSRSVGGRERLEAEIESLHARIRDSGAYIQAETPALAAAALQERVKQAIAAHGGGLNSQQNLAPSEEDGFTRVGMRVMMTATLDEIFFVLHELEAGAPLAFVDNLEIKSNSVRRGRVDRDADSILSIRFDVFGYLPPEAAS